MWFCFVHFLSLEEMPASLTNFLKLGSLVYFYDLIGKPINSGRTLFFNIFINLLHEENSRCGIG